MDFLADYLTTGALSAFGQVIIIDLVLAGDNAIVIALAAAGLPANQRTRAILVGIMAATILRIGFASITVQLLDIIGLLLAGGLLLLWVCWKMWRELRLTAAAGPAHRQTPATEGPAASSLTDDGLPKKTFGQAALQILIADVTMSLDNVLAVAGASRDYPLVLVFGLMLSIALMGVAAAYIAQLLYRYRWIAYAGLAVILYVALDMIWRGALDVWPHVQAALT